VNDILENRPTRLSIRRGHGRAINAVAELLRKQLRVPEIYLDPKITGFPSTDVLAVDEAGSGDFHAVDLRAMAAMPTRMELRRFLAEAKKLPFHYRYIAMPRFAADLSDPYLRFTEYPELFDESGIGRIGIISFSNKVLDPSAHIDETVAQLVIRPERFLVRGEKLVTVEKFLRKARPDMEVRL
jgi:hypothetical protein